MAKRKANGDDKRPTRDKMDVDGEEEDEDASLIDVDFEWFDFDPEIDFHGLKTLLRQLFDVDNDLLDLSELADIILAQPELGTVVKCDGKESDPFAFLTVLDLHRYQEKAVMKQLTQYLQQRTADVEGIRQLREVLSSNSKSKLGLILSERLINMPHQVVPPLYNFLLEEIQTPSPKGSSEALTHYLILSKTYEEVASKLDAGEERPAKKKKASATSAAETFYFHPEDEALQKHALAHCSFDYAKQGDEGASDSKRAFQDLGVRPQGHLILMDAMKFRDAVKAVESYLGYPS
ncbi:hypothetical protein BAUCODRAFT_297383 [Baudoinia panamericana UAMH 10762]|uniref:Protein BCP1 n=1 Tax=Baudoinia panamericana (strain UAMH 10762) TaxID=717646 RepID=M2MZ20_BAUPA|nr:uncharacterized protein BAUCODRAFT_297383 [Baudoinia panamericana UAMH 10762]EMC91555.1 hypothetical protein BAUCODRAFT_297383 [Baudoinia panamericana UAMH 10762]